MRAFITGGAGFIGSHLADALIARGDAVFHMAAALRVKNNMEHTIESVSTNSTGSAVGVALNGAHYIKPPVH